MVEQRSPKPLVACSNRVSPAKTVPNGIVFLWGSKIEYQPLSLKGQPCYLKQSRLPCQNGSEWNRFFMGSKIEYQPLSLKGQPCYLN